jgi:hypothetical protein
MGYSKYKKLKSVKDKFGCRFVSENIFSTHNIQPIPVSEWLRISLERAYNTPPTNEKSKSERLVSPILLEVLDSYKNVISFFSGEEININANDNLAGPCDFFYTLTPPSLVLELPIISVAEAKNEDLEWGLAQCAAQVYAAHLLNLQDGRNIPILYGCSTTGSEWQFFRYENNTFYIDKTPMTDLPQVLGTWHWILNFYVTNFSNQ